jgi:hypothetical protein
METVKRALPIGLAIAFGLMTVLGLFFFSPLSDLLTGWGSFLAAVALMLGLLNLLGVHWRRVGRGNFYSAVLVLAFLGMVALGVLDVLGVTSGGLAVAFDNVLLPLEAALASLMAFFLIFAAVRLLRREPSGWSLLFITTVLIVFLGRIALPAAAGDVMVRLSDFVSDVMVNAGLRAILLGVALGTITITLRVLSGSERPYDK